jgi:hypothetical protein
MTDRDVIVIHGATEQVEVIDNALDVKASRGPDTLPFTEAEKRLYGVAGNSSSNVTADRGDVPKNP